MSKTIDGIMDALAKDGWCVVLKRMPPKLGWILEGSRSEYDAPCEDRIIGKGKWCVELHDMSLLMGKKKWRHNVDAFGDTALECLEKATANSTNRK